MFIVTRSAIFAVLCGSLSLTACDDASMAEATVQFDGHVLTPDTRPLGVMTFNVLCSFCDDTYDPWDERLAYFDDIFARHDPDLIGLQELAFDAEVQQILDRNPGYAAIFYETYPDATILYRLNRFEPLESGFYWLSPTPEDSFSTGFAESQLPRLVAWSRLRQKTDGRELLFASTHFDNNSPSQERSAPLLLERTAPWAETYPVIIVGDFNSQTFDLAYATLVSGETNGGFHFVDSHDVAAARSIATNQSPVPAYDAPGRIDHIFLAGTAEWAIQSWVVDMTTYGPNNRYPSDHFAVAATLAW